VGVWGLTEGEREESERKAGRGRMGFVNSPAISMKGYKEY